MKSRIALSLSLSHTLSLALLFVLVAATAFAADAPVAAQSEAQKSFRTMKSVAREWEGPVAVPEMPEMSNGKPLHVSLRVTSRGNTLVHELQEAGTPLDPRTSDNPVSMVYLAGDKLALITSCVV